MRIAVTYEDGHVIQHFGHTSQFKIYDINADQILASQVVDTNGVGHGSLAGFLKDESVDLLICGGIGGGAQNALMDAGILFKGGVAGSADQAVLAYMNGTLDYNPNVHCDHHDHAHGESCGHHHENGGCGQHGHSCGHHH